jgi:hypothetical protein
MALKKDQYISAQSDKITISNNAVTHAIINENHLIVYSSSRFIIVGALREMVKVQDSGEPARLPKKWVQGG